MIRKTIVFGLLLLLLSGLLYESYHDSPTYDEPANMAAAFDYVWRGDFRIYPDNPPLVKILAGFALFPLKDKIYFPSELESYQDAGKFDLYKFGTDFLYSSGNDAEAIKFFARLPNILMTVVLGFLLYKFASRLYGGSAGLIALFLYALDPNIRGHGHILAFDIPLAFIMVLILYATYIFFKNSKIKDQKSKSKIKNQNYYIFIIPILFSLGLLTKFSFIFFAGIYLSGLLIFFICHPEFISGSIAKKKMLKRVQHDNNVVYAVKIWFSSQFLIIVFSFLLLWLFGFITNYNKSTLDYSQLASISSANEILAEDWKWNLIKNLPVPYYYKTGMMVMYTHNLVSQPAFLLGEVRQKNDWFLYFPISFLLKSPLPTLILIIITPFLLLKRFLENSEIKNQKSKPQFKTQNYENKEIKLIPAYLSFFPYFFGFSFMFFMMVFSHINNVFRYLFPAYVMFILGSSQIVCYLGGSCRSGIPNFASKSPRLLAELKDREATFGNPSFASPVKIFMILNSCFLILTSLLSFPYDLSYTNQLTGIPSKGYKYLSDSEVDWGQDLARLGEYLKKEGKENEEITLSYLGTADPAYYGIKYKPLKFEDLKNLKGTVVISAANMTLGDWMVTSRPDYKKRLVKAPLDDLRKKEPDAVVGKSIFLYEF